MCHTNDYIGELPLVYWEKHSLAFYTWLICLSITIGTNVMIKGVNNGDQRELTYPLASQPIVTSHPWESARVAGNSQTSIEAGFEILPME